MTISAKVARNTIVQLISKIIATFLGVFTIAIMARYLGQSGFGQYTTIITFLTFFATIADLGLTLVTVQLISAPGARQEKTINNLFAFRLVSSLFFLGLAIIISLFLPYSAIIKFGIIITTLSFLFISFNQILVGIFQKNLRMEKVAIAEVSSRLFLFIGTYFVYILDRGLIGILVVTILSSFLSFILHYIFAREFVIPRFEFDFSFWKSIISKSWPIALTIFFNLIYLRTDTIFLSLIKTQAEVGIYGAAYKVIDVLITVPFMFAGIVLPLMTSAWFKNNKKQFENITQRSFDLMVMLALPIFIGALFTAEKIMTLIAGPSFGISGPVLKILITASSIIFVGTVFSHAIIALDKQKKIISSYIFVAITALVGYLIFIPKYSYFGAAWVTVYSELTIALASFYLVYKYSGFLPNLKVSLKALLSSLVMAIFLYYFQNLNIFFLVSGASLIYFSFLYISGAVTKTELLEIINNNAKKDINS